MGGVGKAQTGCGFCGGSGDLARKSGKGGGIDRRLDFTGKSFSGTGGGWDGSNSGGEGGVGERSGGVGRRAGRCGGEGGGEATIFMMDENEGMEGIRINNLLGVTEVEDES